MLKVANCEHNASQINITVNNMNAETQPLRYSIHVCAFSAGSVSLMNFKASSNKTSPVGESDLHNIFRSSNSRRRAPAFSSSIRPRKDSSMSMQPRNPDDKQSFQNDVYPCKNSNLKG